MRRRVLVDSKPFTGSVEVISRPKHGEKQHLFSQFRRDSMLTTSSSVHDQLHGLDRWTNGQATGTHQHSPNAHNSEYEMQNASAFQTRLPCNSMSLHSEISLNSVDSCVECFPTLVNNFDRNDTIDYPHDPQAMACRLWRYVNIDDLTEVQAQYDEHTIAREGHIGTHFLTKADLKTLSRSDRHINAQSRIRKFDILPESLKAAISESHLYHSRKHSAIIPPFHHADFPQCEPHDGCNLVYDENGVSICSEKQSRLPVHLVRRPLPLYPRHSHNDDNNSHSESYSTPRLGEINVHESSIRSWSGSNLAIMNSKLYKKSNKERRAFMRGTAVFTANESAVRQHEPLTFPLEVDVTRLGQAYDSLEPSRPLAADFGIYCDLMYLTMNEFISSGCNYSCNENQTIERLLASNKDSGVHPLILQKYSKLIKRCRDLQWIRSVLNKRTHNQNVKAALPFPGLPRSEIEAWSSLGLFPQTTNKNFATPPVSTELLLSVLYPENANNERQLIEKFNKRNLSADKEDSSKEEDGSVTTGTQSPATVQAGAYLFKKI